MARIHGPPGGPFSQPPRRRNPHGSALRGRFTLRDPVEDPRPEKQIAKFSVPHLQVLDENGKVDAALEPDLGQERAVEMYRWMRLARELDERMLKLQRQGRLGTFPPCTGHEAVSVPVAMAMKLSLIHI
mgnify:CR=1 FL=1